MRKILRKTMSQLGYTEIQEAEHGADALKCLADSVPQLALVDWNMPVMGGQEFIVNVREQRDYDNVKVLVVSSESNPRVVYEALKAGADDYAMKPITSDVINEKLQLLGLAQ